MSIRRQSNQKNKVLITCIEWRKKYTNAVGDVDTFDQILDITELVRDRTGKYGFRPEYPDRITERTLIIDEIRQLEEFLQNSLPDICIIFRPELENKNMGEVFKLSRQYSRKVGICSNKFTVKYITVKKLVGAYFISFLYRLEALFVKRDFLFDVLYTNSLVQSTSLFKSLKFKRVSYVSHLDAIKVRKDNSNPERLGLFIDSYFPFHKECIHAYGPIDPKEMYDQLGLFLTAEKKRHNLDRIVICRHPNSEGKEIPFLEGFETAYLNTMQLVPKAQICWSFGSNAASFCIQIKVPVINVVFPNLFYPGIKKFITTRSLSTGIPLIFFDGKVTKYRNYSIWNPIKRMVFRRFFKKNKPYLSDYL